jgi:hypothetical protein
MSNISWIQIRPETVCIGSLPNETLHLDKIGFASKPLSYQRHLPVVRRWVSSGRAHDSVLEDGLNSRCRTNADREPTTDCRFQRFQIATFHP